MILDSAEGVSGKYRSSALKKTYAFNEKGEVVTVDSYTDEHYDVPFFFATQVEVLLHSHPLNYRQPN
jgi:hypothetical protein